MPKYSPEIQAAFDAIKAAGQQMVLIRIDRSTAYDPVSPQTGRKHAVVTDKCAGVVLPASNGTIEAFDDRALSQPAVKKSFRFVILSAKGLTISPLANDVLKTAEGYYRVLGATPLNPSGDGAIIYNVGCTTDLEGFIKPSDILGIDGEDSVLATQEGNKLAFN